MPEGQIQDRLPRNPVAPTPPPGIAAPPVAAPAPPTPAAAAPSGDHLKESKNSEGLVLLFGDADMIYDGLCLEKDPFGGIRETNGNLSMMLGAIELYSGGGDLISVRNRASTTRPFTTMEKKKAQVEEQFRPQMSKLWRTRRSHSRAVQPARQVRQKDPARHH